MGGQAGGKWKSHLERAATDAGGIEEVVAEAEELHAPVHDDLLELGACWASNPLQDGGPRQ